MERVINKQKDFHRCLFKRVGTYIDREVVSFILRYKEGELESDRNTGKTLHTKLITLRILHCVTVKRSPPDRGR